MVNFGYPYNDIVICKDSTDYLDLCWVYVIWIADNSKPVENY